MGSSLSLRDAVGRPIIHDSLPSPTLAWVLENYDCEEMQGDDIQIFDDKGRCITLVGPEFFTKSIPEVARLLREAQDEAFI